jgi:glycosyltransferase involved in cell wall biosynthesis
MDNFIFIGKYCLAENFQSASAKRVLNQLKYLEKKAEINVITFSSKKCNLKYAINFKIPDNKGILYLLKLPFYWFSIIFILFKRKKWKSNNFLILESIVELNTIIPLIFAFFFRYKIVHDVVEDFWVGTEITKKQKKNLLISKIFYNHINKYCAGCIVISDRLFEKYQSYSFPIIKIYNSVKPFDRKIYLNPNAEKFTFFYSGTFGEKDGVIDLIKAFNNVYQIKDNIELQLVGKGSGQYYNECMKQIKKNKNIHYLGYLPENKMFNVLVNSNVLCVTRTNSEFANNGFPFKLAEYMSSGIPVLATTASDIPKLLNDKQEVYLAEPGNIDSITKKMIYIIDNYQEAIKVGKRGRIFCEEKFSINYIGEQLYLFLKKI